MNMMFDRKATAKIRKGIYTGAHWAVLPRLVFRGCFFFFFLVGWRVRRTKNIQIRQLYFNVSPKGKCDTAAVACASGSIDSCTCVRVLQAVGRVTDARYGGTQKRVMMKETLAVGRRPST